MGKYQDLDETLLKAITVAAVIILGSIVASKIFLYSDIPIHWQIAIATFILFLPFYFFLQVSLNIKYTRESLLSDLTKIQDKMRNLSIDIRMSTKQPTRTIPGRDVRNDYDFFNMVKERAEYFSNDIACYATYLGAYKTLLKKEKERSYSEEEIKRRKLDLLDLEFYDLLKDDVEEKMQEKGITFHSYLLPLSFFLFTYFAGFLIILPLINSVFVGKTETIFIPLFNEDNNIPILVIQWGFLGGFVYTSISLLSRFLRNDLVPRVYLLASLRLLLSAVVAIVIFFLFLVVNKNGDTYPQILLICFLAGVAPVQLLINFADTQLSKIYGWKRRSVAGNRPLTHLEGLNSITAERLSEEGIDSILQMALCDTIAIAQRTNFPLEIIDDWHDQAMLYTLTGDIVINDTTTNKEYLNDVLDKKLGIRTISSLLYIYENINHGRDEVNKEKEVSFLKGLNLVNHNENSYNRFHYLFKNVVKQGRRMLRQPYEPDSIRLNTGEFNSF